MHLDSFRHDHLSESERQIQPTLSMSQVQEHSLVSVSPQEQQVDIYSQLMPHEMLVGQVTHQQLPMSMLPESLVLHEVVDTSPNSWQMALV